MKNILLFEDFSVYEVEKVISEDPKAEGPDEKLFTGSSLDREMAKKIATSAGNKEGYPFETSKSKLTLNGTTYKYVTVMTKKAK
jgi:hypothetical protein